MIVGRFVEQMIEPRYSPGGGVDHGAEGKILVIHRRKKLLWRKGHMYWSSIGNQSYSEARLELRDENGDRDARLFGEDLLIGGRLTAQRIAESLPMIRKAMELPGLKAVHFDLKKTFVVDRVGGKK